MNLKKIKTKGIGFILSGWFFRILQRCNTQKNDESHRGGNVQKCSNKNRIWD